MSNHTQLKVGFMGTPDFALAALKALHESTHEVVVVYSQPPRPKGRGQKVQPSPVHAYAESHGIPVFTPPHFKEVEAQGQFAAHNLDVAVVAAYGLILPKAVLGAPKYGCLNIHASLLPRWRGASPIQQAIWHGDAQTGISIMQMDEGLDTGPVISEQSLPITAQDNAASIHDKLSAIGAAEIVKVLNAIGLKGKPEATPQNEAKSTYAPMLKKEDGQLDWSHSPEEIDRQVRALNPWPGVFTEIEGKRVKILEAALLDELSDQPSGTILTRDGHIVCGGGRIIALTKIQPHGAKAMDFISAVNGGHIKPGGRFS